MTLTGLIPLYQSIRRDNLTYAVFDFAKNRVVFHVFFDIDSRPNYKLIILAQGNNFELEVEVMRGFTINPYIDAKKYKQLVKLLNLTYDPDNKFLPTDFFKEFNNRIPQSYNKPKKSILLEFAIKKYHIEENNKIYFRGFKIWSERERTPKNTEKTRILLPLISERIKDRIHISVAYTDVPNNIENADPDALKYRLKEK